MINTVSPDSSYSGKIAFIDHHCPALEDGSYRVTVEQNNAFTSHPVSKTLIVTGPRFDLPVHLIHSHTPMRGSALAQDGVIPTIAFNRNTLPWERSPHTTAEQDGASWLSLILVTEDEIKQGLASESSEALSTAKDKLGIHDLESWPLYEAYQDKEINILSLDNVLYENILPKYGDLKWLSHCRQNILEDENIQAELTYVLGQRLPRPGQRNTVYLVSLEQRYDDTQDGSTAKLLDGNDQSLVYLYKWTFQCSPGTGKSSEKRKGGSFLEIIEKVDVGLLIAPQVDLTDQSEAKQLISSGRSVLPHQLRNGGQTYSWYKGPLSPNSEADLDLPIPADTADDLLVFHQATGMLDTTYAAAWNLGRMKCLENKNISVGLYRWRHRQRHVNATQNHTFNFAHLPFQTPTAVAFPKSVEEKISGYKLLQGLPFENIIPIPEWLPNESLRFFHLDQNWMRAFIDGFFSAGKVAGVEDWAEEQSLFPPTNQAITGILLRSDVVAGWPSIHVKAYPDAQLETDHNDDASVLNVVRKAYLAPDVMLLLFAGIPQTLDFYLSPEGLHTGFFRDDTPSDNPRYIHQVKNPCTGEDEIGTAQANMKLETISNEKGTKDYHTFSAVELQNDFETSINSYFDSHPNKMPCLEGNPFVMTPAYFGFELIEGAPLFRLQIKS